MLADFENMSLYRNPEWTENSPMSSIR